MSEFYFLNRSRLKPVPLNLFRVVLFCIVLSGLPADVTAQVTRYVKPTSTGSGNGTSWSNASNDIQAMINASSSGDRIWIAAGTYVPSTFAGNGSTNRDKAFVLKEGVKLYGGFAGSETALTDRDWNTNVTVLSGDLGKAGDASDNAYHVVIACGTSSSPITAATVLDGFTITGGNGNGTDKLIVNGANVFGGDAGGIFDYYASPLLNNLIVSGNNSTNNGGGIFNTAYSSPSITNSTITANAAKSGGGLCNANYSSPTFLNVMISNNSATLYGGGIYSYGDGTTHITDCTISDNSASYGGGIGGLRIDLNCKNSLITGNSASSSGGGMHNSQLKSFSLINVQVKGNSSPTGAAAYLASSPTVTFINVAFSGNLAQTAGCFRIINSSVTLINVTVSGNDAYALYISGGSTVVIKNSIIFGNTEEIRNSASTISYFNSLVEGVNGGIDGNLDGSVNPLFVTPETPKLSTAGDYRLQPCSPAIGAGDKGWVPDGVSKDLSGETRIYGDQVDMGAYEYQEAIETGAQRLALEGSTITVNVANDKNYSLLVPDDVCRATAVVRSSGSAPVSGNVAVTVWVDPEVGNYKGSPYVQRHYDLSPAVNGTTSTARITLYFTQEEFTAFNDKTTTDWLPVNPDDQPGKGHLRIYQYHGSPSGGNAPGNYAGSPVILDPADEDIVWNLTLKRWEVSFDVTGFSGFFAGSVSSPLPVHVVAFEGRYLDGKKIGLEWKVVQQEKIASYTVEYSLDARNFIQVGQIQATSDTEATYHFDDMQERSGSLAYYRLRILETGGSEALSRIIGVKLPYNEAISVYPVPSFQTLWVKGKGIAGSELKLLDQQGRLVKNMEIRTNEQSLDVSGLPAGVYFIQVPNQGVFRIVKN